MDERMEEVRHETRQKMAASNDTWIDQYDGT